jgi:hypothetical protein
MDTGAVWGMIGVFTGFQDGRSDAQLAPDGHVLVCHGVVVLLSEQGEGEVYFHLEALTTPWCSMMLQTRVVQCGEEQPRPCIVMNASPQIIDIAYHAHPGPSLASSLQNCIDARELQRACS